MRLIGYLRILFLSMLPAALLAQNKDAENYRKASEEVRKQVWAWDKPQFKVKDIPAQYANASKVIIARHTELSAESKSKFAFYVITFAIKKEQTISEVSREMVKLNDKTAIDEYSEISFTQLINKSGFFAKDKLTTYVGVKVIKPNGTVKEINADDIVLTKDETREKRAKLAIPDLQPGDILDYFVATEQTVTNDFSTSTYDIALFDDAPVLSRSFHGQLGKKYSIEYRSYNKAPELKVEKNDSKDIIIDVEKKNMAPFETSLWVHPARQLPFIRMHIALGYKGMGSRFMGTKKPGEVLPNNDPDEYIEARANKLSENYFYGYWMKEAKKEYEEIEKEAKKKAKQMGTTFKDLSDVEKAALLYYTLRFSKLINFEIDALSKTIGVGDNYYNGLAFPVFATLKAAGLDPAILVSAYRSGVKITELMDQSDLMTTTYLTNGGQFFAIQSVFDTPFSIPEEIEGMTGNKSFTFDNPKLMIASTKKIEKLTNIEAGPNVPVTEAGSNAHIENLKLSITADKSKMEVKRRTVVKGHFKADLQRKLITYEDLYESERNSFKEEKSLIEDLQDGRKSKKYVDEVVNAFAEARKKQKEASLKEIKDEFDQEISDFSNYKTENMGIRHTAPDLVYSSTFNMAGLIRKAGNNLIVEIGKIQGTPIKVKQEQRNRDIDVYMPYARSIEYNIELQVPDGYTAEGVEALNKKVANETGFFTVDAVSSGKTVSLKVKKHYLHGFEPAGNWSKLLEFIDAANEWLNAKLLLRKS